MLKTEYLVVGAGLAGLGVMERLNEAGADFIAVEADAGPGGLAATEERNGFRFDRAGHFLHFGSGGLRRAIERCGERLVEHERRSFVLVEGCLIPYPIQLNLIAAPSKVRQGALRDLDRPSLPTSDAKNLGDHLLRTWGPTLSKIFFEPYNRKLWGQPLHRIPPDALGRYLPPPDPALVRRGAEALNSGYGYGWLILFAAAS